MLYQNFLRNDISHLLISCLAGVEVVAAVELRQHACEMFRVRKGLVEINAAVDEVGGAYPFVELRPYHLAERRVGTPALDGQQRADIHLVPELSRLVYVVFHALDEFVSGGHVAHRTERVHLGADRVDYIIDAVLDYYGVCAVRGYLVLKALLSHQPVGLIGDAVVFAQHSCSACGAAYYSGVQLFLAVAAQSEVFGPVLRGDGVAVAHDGAVIRRGEHGNVAQEVNNAYTALYFLWNEFRFGHVAYRVIPLCQRAAGEHCRTQQREFLEIEAYGDEALRLYLAGEFVGNGVFPGADGDFSSAAESYGVEFAVNEHGHFVECDGFRAAVIIEGQAHCLSTEL